MNLEQRVIYDGDDISKEVNDFRAGSAAFVYDNAKYLYIGSILPFNNLWLASAVPNTNAAVVTVEMWWGNEWISAVDVLDETAGLTASGRLQWSTDINKGWELEQRSDDITGLNYPNIYNMYWLRLSWDVDFSALTTLEYVGQKFSSDAILYSFYPDLQIAALKNQYSVGKTSWDEQHYMAAEHIVRDLKKKNMIVSRSQILDHSLFTDASCHKVAEIIYTAFGPPYFDEREAASKQYGAAINIKKMNLDVNANGRLEPMERVWSTGWGTK